VTAETAYAFADVGGHELVLKGAAVPTGVRDACDDCRAAHAPFNLHTPPWSVVTATLTEAFNAEVSTDFTAAIELLDDLCIPDGENLIGSCRGTITEQ
jgi:hypothetical protein